MARFVFILLLIANLAFAGHVYLTNNKPRESLPAEVNPAGMKVVSITDSAKAQRDAQEAKKLVESLLGATCLQLSVKASDAARAQTSLGAMQVDGKALNERVSSRNVEEFTRFAVSLPVQRDRKTAELLLASLKKANVKDVLVLADNSVSLGLFSTEDAAKRVVAELENKANTQVKGIVITPKNPQTRETVFTIREPDATIIAKVALMQRDLEGSALKGIECPASAATAAVANTAGTTSSPAATSAPATATPAPAASTPPSASTAPPPTATPSATPVNTPPATPAAAAKPAAQSAKP
jgi:hypothetical protein